MHCIFSRILSRAQLEEIYSRTAVSPTLSPSFPSECIGYSLPVPSVPNRGRPFSRTALSTASLRHHRSPSPICLSALRNTVLRVYSAPPSLHPPSLPSQHPSLSCAVIDMDAEGVGGPVCQSRRWKMKAQMKEACSVY